MKTSGKQNHKFFTTSTLGGGERYWFGFQGQEAENEIWGEGNASFYKYRISDNRLGRFFAVDPLAPQYPHNSPYAFSENRVIDGVELEGLEVDLTSIDDPVHKYGGSDIKVTNYIYVVGHANPSGISDQSNWRFTYQTNEDGHEERITVSGKNEFIYDAEGFDKMMSTKSEVWQNRGTSEEPIVVILISCQIANFAIQLSEAFPDVYFVASLTAAYPNTDGSYGTYPNFWAEVAKDRSTEGTWYIFKDANVSNNYTEIGTYTGKLIPQYNSNSEKENSNATNFEIIE